MSRSDDKIPNMGTTLRFATENIADALTLGVPPEDIRILGARADQSYYNLTLEMSKRLPFNLMKGVLGHTDLGKYTAVYLQIADILHPQLASSDNDACAGRIDQKPILRLAREMVKSRSKSEYRFLPPSVVYTAHVPSLANYNDKMSKSKPGSALLLSSDRAEFDSVIARAVTGGRDTKAEQVKYGGNPNACPVYELYRFDHPDSAFVKDIYERCTSGKLLCGEDKSVLKGFLRSQLEEQEGRR